MSSGTDASRAPAGNSDGDGDGASAPAMVQEEGLLGLPRDEVPEHGTGTRVACDLMTNELLLDGSARLNLATFVTTWMPPDASRLMAETADKNTTDMADMFLADLRAQTAVLESLDGPMPGRRPEERESFRH